MNTYELLGRQAEEIATLRDAVNLLGAALRSLKAGTRTWDDVTLHEDGRIEVAPLVEAVPTKPTSNGSAPIPLNRHQRRAAAAEKSKDVKVKGD